MTMRRAVCILCLLSLGMSVIAQSPKLSIVGSDTMAVLLTDWSREFQRANPDVLFEIQGTGSAAAPPALAEGTVNFGAMSRAMSAKEISDFQRRTGFPPRGIQVGSDDIAIIVHPRNPLRKVSRETLDGIFSASQRCGGVRYGLQWSGVLGAAQGSPMGGVESLTIQRYSRTAVSGSYGYFKNEVLCGGDFMPQVMELPGFAAIVDAVARSPGAIAYVGAGFVDHRVRVVQILDDGAPLPGAYPGEPDYPFSRPLFLYLAIAPEQALNAMECAFLHHVTGSSGRATLKHHGFQTVGLEVAEEVARVCP